MDDILDESTIEVTIIYFFLIQLLKQQDLSLYFSIEALTNVISDLNIDSGKDAVFYTRILKGITLGEDITPLLEHAAGFKVEVLKGGGGNMPNWSAETNINKPTEYGKFQIQIDGIVLLLYFITMSLRRKFFGNQQIPPNKKLFTELSKTIPLMMMKELLERGETNTSNVALISKRTNNLIKKLNKLRDVNMYVTNTFLPGLFKNTNRTLNIGELPEEKIQNLVNALQTFKETKNVSGLIPAIANIRNNASLFNTSNSIVSSNAYKNFMEKEGIRPENFPLSWFSGTTKGVNTTRRNMIRNKLKKLMNNRFSRRIGKAGYERKATRLQRQLRRAEAAIADPKAMAAVEAIPMRSSVNAKAGLNTVTLNSSLVPLITAEGDLTYVEPSQLPNTAYRITDGTAKSMRLQSTMSLIHLNVTEYGGYLVYDKEDKTLKFAPNITIGNRGSVKFPKFKDDIPPSNVAGPIHGHPDTTDRAYSPFSEADLLVHHSLLNVNGIQYGFVSASEGIYIDQLLPETLAAMKGAFATSFKISYLKGIYEGVNQVIEKTTGIVKKTSDFFYSSKQQPPQALMGYRNLGNVTVDGKNIPVGRLVRYIPWSVLSSCYIDFPLLTDIWSGIYGKQVKRGPSMEGIQNFTTKAINNTNTNKLMWSVEYNTQFTEDQLRISSLFENTTFWWQTKLPLIQSSPVPGLVLKMASQGEIVEKSPPLQELFGDLIIPHAKQSIFLGGIRSPVPTPQLLEGALIHNMLPH